MTTVEDTRFVDDVILQTLADGGVENIIDDEMKPDVTQKVVTYPVPYSVFQSSTGDDDNLRLTGRKGRLSVFFSFKHVGLGREQVKHQAGKVRVLLADKRLVIPGHKSWLCHLEASTRVFRDDDAIRPDGSALFYCVDEYAISITQTHGS